MPPPTTHNLRISLKVGTVVACLIALGGGVWKTSAGWTAFITSFDAFKNTTERHFASIENQLSTNHAEIVAVKEDVSLVRGRQNGVLSDRWTGSNQKDWAYQLDRDNRGLDSGKGLVVPDPTKFITEKKNP